MTRGNDAPHDDELTRRVYAVLLNETHEVCAHALDRLRALSEKYPTAVPPELIDQLERLPDDRRGWVRRSDPGSRVTVRDDRRLGTLGACPVLDASAHGLAFHAPKPAPVGALVGVRVGGDGWALARVRHCRAVRDGWAVGCEFVGDRPEGVESLVRRA